MKGNGIEKAADKSGIGGRAWRMDFEQIAKKFGDEGGHATIAMWAVWAPWAHPIWHSYVVTAIHLRQINGHPAEIILSGATHQVFVAALNPDETPTLDGIPSLLLPYNFIGQWIAGNDDEAIEKIEATVEDIVAGKLSPDTDYIQQWVHRFSASNIKHYPLAPQDLH